MLDLEQVRRAYFHPPDDEHLRPATREEHIARRERNATQLCLAAGRDPRADGLGEHGSLIGGPGKPLRFASHDAKLEYAQPWTPLPLSWFSYPEAMARPHGPPPANHSFLDLLIGTHLAGYPNRPSGEELARILRSDAPSARDRSILYHVLGCIDPWHLPRLLFDERLSVFELARSIHFSRIRRPQVIDWLHMFAVAPEAPEENSPPGTDGCG